MPELPYHPEVVEELKKLQAQTEATQVALRAVNATGREVAALHDDYLGQLLMLKLRLANKYVIQFAEDTGMSRGLATEMLGSARRRLHNTPYAAEVGDEP